MTATDLSIEHYRRPEVRGICSKFGMPEDGTWRGLNGDFHRWYKHFQNGQVRLLNVVEDYDEITKTYRTLYQTLNVFDQSLRTVSRPREEITPDNPLGTPADTVAYTLSTDIDKGHGRELEDPETKQAVEAAAQFLVDYLKARGIHQSVWVAFSGGGIYVQIHHEICKPKSSKPEDRAAFFEESTDRYNRLIEHVSEEFFRVHPEYIGKVKYDALNNSKRVFKCILSIHKKKPYAVTPLNRDAIRIDLERARVPLKDDIIAEARVWYSTYDPAELEPLLRLLDEYKETEAEAEKRKSKHHHFEEIWRSPSKIEQYSFCPCLKHITDVENTGEGQTRFSAILSTFLYQMGWDETEAWELVRKVSDRNSLPNANHIFDSCFGRVSCPNCLTIQNDGAGYPHLGLKNLGVCKPDEHCKGCVWPGDYPFQKILNESRGSTEPSYRLISKDDPKGSIGVCPQTGCVKKVVELETDDGQKKFLSWVSDCPVYIHTETRANDDTEFTFVGTGAVDKRQVKFTLPATALAEPKKFKAALINAFGAKNKPGALNFEMVQEITQNTRILRRIEVPTWDGSTPLVPGVGLADDVEFRLSSMVPAAVCDGDLGKAKECLRKFLRLHKYAPILATTVLGAPAFARWHSNDRFGVALWGLTGSLKTSVAQAAQSIYGTGYLDDEALLKHGKAGATQVATLEVFANAGILPQLLDNVKTVDEKDSLQYIATIQAVIEGREKQRGKKEGGLRDSRIFNCTPIITGEIRPEEASTSARVLNLAWTRPEDLAPLSYVQEHVSSMPIIGYHWLRFLASTDLNLVDGFNEARGRKMAEFSKKLYVNPGRLATIYTLLISAWELLCESPFGDVFCEFTDSFVSALDQVIEAQGATVTEETEVEKFLAGLKELMASSPGLIQSQDGRTILGRIIGKWTDEGLFLLPSETLAELAKIRVFSQVPTIDSLTKALHAAGKLVVNDGDPHLKPRRRINGIRSRGWLLDPVACAFGDPVSPYTGDAETDNGKANVPTVPTVPGENERKNFKKNLEDFGARKENHKISGDTGDSGDSIVNNNITDIDSSNPKGVPSGVPSGSKSGDIVGPASGLEEDLILAEERARQREVKFKTPARRKKIVAVRFLEDCPPFTKDDVAGLEGDEAYDLLAWDDPPICESVIAHEKQARFWEAVMWLLRKYPRVTAGRRGVTAGDVADRSGLALAEVEAMLRASEWEMEVIEMSGLLIWWASDRAMRVVEATTS